MAELEYYKVLESGMFFEFYPELTGDYSKDKWEWKIIYQNLLNIRKKMDAPGHDKDYYEFVKQHRLRNKSNYNDMKQKLEYEKIESSNDALMNFVQFHSNPQPIPIPPKPILFIQVPENDNEFRFDFIEKYLNDNGWILLWVYSKSVEKYEIQSFTLKDSQELEIEALKETILKEIKGK